MSGVGTTASLLAALMQARNRQQPAGA